MTLQESLDSHDVKRHCIFYITLSDSRCLQTRKFVLCERQQNQGNSIYLNSDKISKDIKYQNKESGKIVLHLFI